MCLVLPESFEYNNVHDNDKKMVFTIRMGEMTPERIEKAKQSLKEMMCEFQKEVDIGGDMKIFSV